MAGPDGALVRGAHWRNFLVKYPESNRMHKKMHGAERARPAGAAIRPAVRRAIGRAQCNDAYWHGVFGGLYLPHLRDAIWRNLAEAEAALRRGEGLAWDVLDFDGDGNDEIWVHSRRLLRGGEPGPRRRGRGVHRLRQRHQLRQRADPPAEATTSWRSSGARPTRATATAAPRAFTTSRRASASTRGRRSTPTTARCSWTGSCRAASALEQYAGGDYWAILSLGADAGASTRRRAPQGRRRDRVHLPPAGRNRLEKRIRFEPSGRLDGALALGPGRSRARRSVRHRAVGGRARSSRCRRRRPTSGGTRDRDGRQVRARPRPHPAGRVDHAALAVAGRGEAWSCRPRPRPLAQPSFFTAGRPGLILASLRPFTYR